MVKYMQNMLSLHEDGRKFKTLKKRLKSVKEAMIILKTSENNVVGAFSGVPFKFDGKGKHIFRCRWCICPVIAHFKLKKIEDKDFFFR